MRPAENVEADPDTPPQSRIHNLVLAGGRGTRLQHVTTALGEPREKQFCRLGGRRSLLQQTIDRLLPLAGSERTTVVIRGDHHDLAASQLAAYPETTVVAQPGDRGTGVGVLAALLATLRSSNAGITILSPADHAFTNEPALREVLSEAIDLARTHRAPILIGAEADAPRSDFGWIVASADPDGGPARVERFVEKPPREEAEVLLRCGGVFNTMLMVAPTSVLFTSFAEACPDVFAELLPAAFMEGERRGAFLRWAFNEIESVDFSRDVLGRARGLRLVTLPASAGWTDLGDERRLLEWLEAQGDLRTARDVRAVCRSAAPRRTRRSRSRPVRRPATEQSEASSGFTE